jgi:hypothetical protein
MDEPSEKLAADATPEPAPRSNRGRFQPGDRRINREGRPQGSRTAATGGEDMAPKADRLMRLEIKATTLLGCLSFGRVDPRDTWFVANLPRDVQVVPCRFDAAGRTVVLILWSASFPRVARGTPIPRFEAKQVREQLEPPPSPPPPRRIHYRPNFPPPGGGHVNEAAVPGFIDD